MRSGLQNDKVVAIYIVAALSAFCVGMALASPKPANASHTVYTTNSQSYNASPFNGYRVYLSSPTHTNSGSKGELGWDENINGRHFNVYAANSSYKYETASTSWTRNLRARGYNVTVSENSRAGLFMDHVTEANNWGADIYITTHTNGGGGNYFLVLVDKQAANSNDLLLQDKMDDTIGNAVPGSDVQDTDASPYTNWSNLGELGPSNDAPYNVYVEVIFHDNQGHVDWFGSGSNWIEVTNFTWRYGWAIDLTLGYP